MTWPEAASHPTLPALQAVQPSSIYPPRPPIGGRLSDTVLLALFFTSSLRPLPIVREATPNGRGALYPPRRPDFFLASARAHTVEASQCVYRRTGMASMRAASSFPVGCFSILLHSFALLSFFGFFSFLGDVCAGSCVYVLWKLSSPNPACRRDPETVGCWRNPPTRDQQLRELLGRIQGGLLTATMLFRLGDGLGEGGTLMPHWLLSKVFWKAVAARHATHSVTNPRAAEERRVEDPIASRSPIQTGPSIGQTDKACTYFCTIE